MKRRAAVGDGVLGAAGSAYRVRSAPSTPQLVAGMEPNPRVPGPGERAAGHGIGGIVAGVPDRQPLAADGIWRVVLAGEAFGRLVGRGANGTWRLLSLDDLTDAQLDAFAAALGDPARPGAAEELT